MINSLSVKDMEGVGRKVSNGSKLFLKSVIIISMSGIGKVDNLVGMVQEVLNQRLDPGVTLFRRLYPAMKYNPDSLMN